jgi:Protein of unknown function (DUF3574)
MKRTAQTFFLTLVLLTLGRGTAFSKDTPCPFSGQRPMLVTRLYFGQTEDGKPLAPGQWDDFLAHTVTPRFANGLTVYDAQGQWRDQKTKTIVQEAAKVVEIAAANSPGLRSKIEDVARLYRVRFHQKSVGIVSRLACGAF